MKDVAEDRKGTSQEDQDYKRKEKKRFAKKYTSLASLWAFYSKNFTIQNNNTKDNKKPNQKEAFSIGYLGTVHQKTQLGGWGGGGWGVMYKTIQARDN